MFSKKLVLAASLLTLVIASCSKKDDNNNPQPTTTNAKFTYKVSTSDVILDSIVTKYQNSAGAMVATTYINTNSWESPAMDYKPGQVATASVKAYGRVVGSGSVITSLYLIRTATQGIISSAGTATKSGGFYTFSGDLSYTF